MGTPHLSRTAVYLATLLSVALPGPSSAGYCPNDPLIPAPSAVAPIALDLPPSTNRAFSYPFRGGSFPISESLVGITHEFLCHVARTSTAECTLGNHVALFDTLATAHGNVVRVYSVLNHSPGTGAQGTPYADEQPFARVGSLWNVAGGTPTTLPFLANLETVVRDAYCRHIIVELTLLDPWDASFTQGPFWHTNTTTDIGFASQRQFMTWENLGPKTDTTPSVVSARTAQMNAVKAVVTKLKPYPNIIWELANEADLIPNGSGITPADVAAFESTVRSWITAIDTTHLIMANGHTPQGYAWAIPGGGFSVSSSHYVFIDPDPREGAIETLRDNTWTPFRANYGMAFNEGKAYGVVNVDRDDIRSEAWDYLFNGGNSFDAYSINYSASDAAGLTNDLGGLATVMSDSCCFPTSYFNFVNNLGPSPCNGPSDWCKFIPGYGSADATCANDAITFWSALKASTNDEFGLYLHHAAKVNNPGAPGNPFLRYDARVCPPSGPSYSLPNVKVRVPTSGCWILSWVQPKSNNLGPVVLSQSFQQLQANVDYARPSPAFKHDIALFLTLESTGQCF